MFINNELYRMILDILQTFVCDMIKGKKKKKKYNTFRRI